MSLNNGVSMTRAASVRPLKPEKLADRIADCRNSAGRRPEAEKLN
jgi:hypothetical protein